MNAEAVIDPPDTDAEAATPGRSRNYTVLCLSEALSPITHMSKTEGNEAIVAREPVVSPRGIAWVPSLSGNAIRHRACRSPGMRWLIDEYGLAGTLTLAQLNFIFHGGSLTEGGGREDTSRIADFQRLFPLGRLLGGSLPDQILAGNLQVWRGTLVCEENRGYLAAVLPEGAMPERLRPAETFVSGYTYTRSDASKSHADLASPESRAEQSAGNGSSNLMIFAGQSVLRGAAFVHGFTLPQASTVELGALLWSLRLWQAAGGTLGGQAARGHGRLALSILADDADPIDHDAAVEAYREHARSVRDEAVAWLHSVFAPKASKAGKASGKGRGGKGKADAGPDPDASDDGPSLLPGD